MEWLNLRSSSLRAPEYIGCDPVSRATWLNVLAYSVEQENSGRLKGAAAWKDRQWQQTCGVTLSEVQSASPLLKFDGEDLVVWSYPVDKEIEIKANRIAGKTGGSRTTAEKAEAARRNGSKGGRPSSKPKLETLETQAETQTIITGNPSGNPTEGEEEREIEGKRNGNKKKGISADGVESFENLPSVLNRQDFKDQWTVYLAFRRERRFPKLGTISISQKWNEMSEWGPDASIAAMREAISNGWQGTFYPKKTNGNKPITTRRTADDRDADRTGLRPAPISVPKL